MMSGYGYEAGTYGGYGGGYGYYDQLGPAYFDLNSEAAQHLSGPGSTFTSSSSQRSEYLHENENGSIFGQFYHHSGSYYAIQTSYSYSSDGTTYYSSNEFVRDASGLSFSQFYNRQPIYATSGSFYESGYSVKNGGYSTGGLTKASSYSYDNGSYRNEYSDRTFERGYSGAYVPHTGSYYHASTYYDASTGYTYGSHN